MTFHVPVPGWYSSALAKAKRSLAPPATSTSLSGNNVAVCWARGTCMCPVAVHVPADGLYNSALFRVVGGEA